ncbi:hypothetical protein SPAR_41854 [Streptomyces sparsogenes DSM 40356]|uniref:Uncharacterized protein n=1 Tax=Streptomyces sparsogenes DSM 40356 TaxID=1331668 RepID=A0A1R1S547_9ACTN|nr:hypothetical protein [Streptomyces sparsogenes]OMI33366.1 hypothetical protein SPAR_41854 [Streptomyces sparsogenes DSM 40356]
MLPLVVAHDHDRVRALTEKPDHLTGRRPPVDQVTDTDEQIVRADADLLQQFEQLVEAAVDVTDDDGAPHAGRS